MGSVLTIDELTTRLDAERKAGKRVVFTNGCFDLIHAGHVRYLKEARALGDILVIGLNTDASVSRLKPGRPLNSEADRAEVLSSLGAVDFVILFDEDTPYDLIQAIKPDVLVKGGDWDVKDIVGSDIVSDTRSLPFAEGYSTTKIIDKAIALDDAPLERDWVEALVTYDSMEAEIVRDLLRSGGVEVRDVSLKIGVMPVNVGRMGETKLYVHERNLEEAKRLINEQMSES